MRERDSDKPERTEAKSPSSGVCTSCKKVVVVERDANGRKVGLRRGLCRACYLREWRGAALPADAHCATCPERRRTLLRWTKLGEDRVVTCHNCGFLVDHARPRPSSREELTALLERERRGPDRRRNYSIDGADPAERRRAVRRARRRAKLA